MSTTEPSEPGDDSETELRELSMLLWADVDEASAVPEPPAPGVVPSEGASPSIPADPDNLRALARDLFHN